MKKRVGLTFVALAGMLLFSGCAEDNYYNGGYYNNTQSSYDRKMDYEARKDAAESAKMLSAQDIKNLENMANK